MATGYTSKIYEDKQQSFEEFALLCARAFGACIMQREDDSDALPEMQKPSDCHAYELEKAKIELTKFNELSKEDFRKDFDKYIDDQKKYNKKALKDRTSLKNRYQEMLDKVHAWNPPTEDHSGLKDFMIEQLNSSIQFDCSGDYYERSNKELEELTFDEWYFDKKDSLNKSVQYHADANKKEIDTARKRNKWIKDLYDSLSQK